MGKKEQSVQKAVLNALADWPTFGAALKNGLTRLSEIRGLRNPLMHGLWRRLSDGVFEVQPLHFDRTTQEVHAAFKVDAKFLADVLMRTEKLIDLFHSLGSEMVAHQFLERAKLRRLSRSKNS
jgi:hypothetical protein